MLQHQSKRIKSCLLRLETLECSIQANRCIESLMRSKNPLISSYTSVSTERTLLYYNRSYVDVDPRFQVILATTKRKESGAFNTKNTPYKSNKLGMNGLTRSNLSLARYHTWFVQETTKPGASTSTTYPTQTGLICLERMTFGIHSTTDLSISFHFLRIMSFIH